MWCIPWLWLIWICDTVKALLCMVCLHCRSEMMSLWLPVGIGLGLLLVLLSVVTCTLRTLCSKYSLLFCPRCFIVRCCTWCTNILPVLCTFSVQFVRMSYIWSGVALRYCVLVTKNKWKLGKLGNISLRCKQDSRLDTLQNQKTIKQIF